MKHLLFALLLIVPICLTGQNRESDSLALLQLYSDLNGPEWTKGENWLTSAPLEEWEGISTTNDRVWKVELKQFGAFGSFPNSILELSELHTLEIKSAEIDGELPNEMANLPKLNRLILDNCGISGEVPSTFHDFPTLATCILSFNDLSGTLPALLPSNLTYLSFRANQLTGTIPSTWQGANLSRLTMQDNMLEGNFDILGTMANLSHFDLSSNHWDEGPFPDWADDLSNLSWFACENCNLSGDLPVDLDFSNSNSHDRVLISNNNLSGDISLLFTASSSVGGIYLRARSNNFSGEFPAHKVTSANLIDVRDNKYSSISDFGDVAFNNFDISFNNFTFSTLEPVKSYIQLDSIIGVNYDPQNETLNTDTVIVTEATSIIIEAGDEYSGITYEWYDNFTLIEGETSSSITIAIDESYSDSRYRCKMNHADYPELDLYRNYFYIQNDISTSVKESKAVEFQVFPNPTRDMISITGVENCENTSYSINRVNGQVLMNGKVSPNCVINVQNLDSGMYLIKLYDQEEYEVEKFFKI